MTDLTTKYGIEIQYGNYEGEWCYQASCQEFPDLFDYADSYEEVLELITESLEITVDQLAMTL